MKARWSSISDGDVPRQRRVSTPAARPRAAARGLIRATASRSRSTSTTSDHSLRSASGASGASSVPWTWRPAQARTSPHSHASAGCSTSASSLDGRGRSRRPPRRLLATGSITSVGIGGVGHPDLARDELRKQRVADRDQRLLPRGAARPRRSDIRGPARASNSARTRARGVRSAKARDGIFVHVQDRAAGRMTSRV